MRYLSVLVVLSATFAGSATAGEFAGYGKPDGCCDTACAPCSKTLICCKEEKVVKVEKSCFDVECKHICIPAITFPWQQRKNCDSCDGNCDTGCCNGAGGWFGNGRIIAVNKLVKRKYECEKVVCVWTIREMTCDDSKCDSDPAYDTPARPPVPPPASASYIRSPQRTGHILPTSAIAR